MRQSAAKLAILLCIAIAASLTPFALSAERGRELTQQEPATLGLPPGYDVSALTVMLDLASPADGPLVRDRLAALGVPVLYEARLAYQGIAVSAAPEQLAALRALPGVSGTRVIPPKQRSLASVVASIGVAQFWSGSGEITGRGVRIGIIDSGIDYTHATFGGPGTREAFAANDPTLIESGSFPTEKVIGGYDFVGDAYDAVTSPVPQPDADPLDCAVSAAEPNRDGGAGHGTHIAAIAAGFGVGTDGKTYRGHYTGSLSYRDFPVGPGIAPHASLVALKIFGCSGSTTYLTRAIDYALDPNGDGSSDDRLVDVLSISLGSPFGGADDPDTVAVNRAVQEGVVVVVAAGDSGNTFYAIDSPANAHLAIAVGASADAEGDPSLGADTLDGLTARGPARGNSSTKPDLVAPGVAVRSAAAGSGNTAVGLSGTSVAAPQVAGGAALLRQLRPSWSPAQIKAALVNAASATRQPDGTPYPASLTGAGRLDLINLFAPDLLAYAADDPGGVGLAFGAPWVSEPRTIVRTLRLENTGRTVRLARLRPLAFATENGVTVSIPAATLRLPPGATVDVPVTLSVDPSMLDFTRDAATPPTQGLPGGPQFDRYYMAEHSGIVEIVSTVGARVRAAHAANLGDVTVTLDATQVDATLRQGTFSWWTAFEPGSYTVRVRSRWNPSEIFAEQPVALQDGRDYTVVVWEEAGQARVTLVEDTPSVELPREQSIGHFFNGNPFGDGSAVDVYVGEQRVAAGLPVGAVSDWVAVNIGVQTVRFVPAGQPPSGGARYTFTSSGAFVTLSVAGMSARAVEQRAFGESIRLLNELTARVPFQFFPKSGALASAVSPVVAVPDGAASFAIGLRNSGARNQPVSPRGAQTPLVSAFELPEGGRSPAIGGLAPSLRSADLRYIGVTSDYLVVGRADLAAIFFGVASHGPWDTPSEVQFRVYISTKGPDGLPDDVPEFLLVNVNRGSISPPPPGETARPSDAFVSLLYEILPNGQLVSRRSAFWNAIAPPNLSPFLDSAPYNTSVAFLTTGSRILNLNPSTPLFRYYVETYARDAGGFGERVDRLPASGTFLYDLRFPAVAPLNTTIGGVVPAQLPTFVDVEGGQVTGLVNPAVLAARRSQDVLLLHHHNPIATQAEVVTLTSDALPIELPPGPYRFYMPHIAR